MEIKVLGPGCAKCHEAEKLVHEVLAENSITADVVKVSDLQQIAMLGVFSTPGLVIDGVIKAAGGMPSRSSSRPAASDSTTLPARSQKAVNCSSDSGAMAST